MFDKDGKLITRKLADYTKEIVTEQFATLNEFLNKWNETDKKERLLKELEENGIPVVDLINSVKKKFDLFDLICDVAFAQPPLKRNEKANTVRKRNYFTKYGEAAKQVLETLLDKYADEGIENIESKKNDLVQYLRAVDRDNETVADWFRTLHPAVLRLIKIVLRAAESN